MNPCLLTDPLMGVNVFTQICKYQLQRVSTGELTRSGVNTTLQAEWRCCLRKPGTTDAHTACFTSREWRASIRDCDGMANVWWHLWCGSLTRCIQPSQERNAAPYHSSIPQQSLNCRSLPRVQGQGGFWDPHDSIRVSSDFAILNALPSGLIDGLLTTRQHWQMKMWLSYYLYSTCYGEAVKRQWRAKRF